MTPTAAHPIRSDTIAPGYTPLAYPIVANGFNARRGLLPKTDIDAKLANARWARASVRH